MQNSRVVATNSPELSVVVPVYFEEDSLPTVIPRFLESLSSQRRSFEMIFVNDGSRDRSGEILDEFARNDPRIRVIHLGRNYGQTAAMMAGFLAARAAVTVPLDADGQNEPDDIEMLVDKLDEGWDVVSGWRKDRKDDWLRTNVSRVANGLIGWVTGVKLHDYGCTMKAYRTHHIRDARLYGEMHRFIPVFASMHGARITEQVVRHHPRKAGVSKYGYGRIVKVALDMLLVRMLQKYSTKPLHFFGRIAQFAWAGSLACFIFGIVRAAYSLEAWKAFWGKAPLVGLILFVFGAFMIGLGLVAEVAMRAAYEFNGGRYWTELRRTGFGPSGDEWTSDGASTRPREARAEEIRATQASS
ncbi:MAG: glycosyltransferase family 2 protein [Phycisphaerae bacterium]|nr:glycosyltransferase family 2 protein [Phycisphaerae bacterium]